MELSKEQYLFYHGKKELAAIEQIKKERELTYEEQSKEQDIKCILWQTVFRYGMSLAHAMTRNYTINSDSLLDLQQEMALMFFEKLPEYNPLQCTPTTFYKTRFIEVISKYLQKYVTHVSQYDTKNIRDVNHAIAHFEEKNINWDIEMLSNRTGLSAKVIKRTLEIKNNTNYANIDENETLQLKSRIDTPEEYMERVEQNEILKNVMLENIPAEDLEIFLMRYNIDGDKKIPYEQVAKKCGKSIRDVRKIVNSVTNELAQNETLRKRFATNNTRHFIEPLKFNDKAADIQEAQLMQNLGYQEESQAL